ncbi:MAG: LamG-like jellyroll fold domain-containing protein, partial [Opitutaceae bacterium]|nr:LamG-like jellyroll fold domain-containing protein [Opitutaceae bacterium]
EYNAGTGILPAHEDDVGGFPVIASGTAYADTDQDGMADAWEMAQFGNLSQTNNGIGANGHTHLENFLSGQFGVAGVPAAPATLTATVAAAPNNINQINLSWTNVASETGYKIDRKKGASGAYSQIAATAADVVTYNDTTAGAGTLYYYKVRAYNGSGNGAYSPEANTTTAEVTSGRQAHWKFDATSGTTATDSSGNANTGTLVNGPTWVAGKIGNAVNFDAVNDLVNGGSGATLDNLPALTVSAWVKANSYVGRIVHKDIGTVSTVGWQFYQNGSGSMGFVAKHATTNINRISAANAISLGAWNHVMVTWTGSSTATNAKIYVNGVETGYATTTNGVGTRGNDATASAFIGNNDTGVRTFDGALDDVRIYNRVLTASEIQAVYRAGL